MVSGKLWQLLLANFKTGFLKHFNDLVCQTSCGHLQEANWKFCMAEGLVAYLGCLKI